MRQILLWAALLFWGLPLAGAIAFVFIVPFAMAWWKAATWLASIVP